VDLTLNGWAHSDAQSREVGKIDLTHGGRDRWDLAIVRRAMRYRIDAGRGSADFSPPATGEKAYVNALYYQLRELIDPAKIVEYDRAKQSIQWEDYHSNARTELTVREFREGLIEYQARLGFWGDGGDGRQRSHLEQAYGHLHHKRIGLTQAAIGGVDRTHPFGCTCMWCGAWEPVDMPALDDAVGRGVLQEA
jgi:hypothetical protein